MSEETPGIKIEGYSIRQSGKTDDIKIRELGLKSYKNMVFFSKDVAEYKIITRYEEFLNRLEISESKHCKYVAETNDNRIVGYVWIGVASFNEKIGNVYDFAVDHGHKDTEIGKALIAQAESWSKENGLLTSYFLLHTNDDISQEMLSSLGYGTPGYFMEKDLSRIIQSQE
ncbi:MAG: GNAT family N-acetyltransferase [Candidatus Thorarchaeota archaeon]